MSTLSTTVFAEWVLRILNLMSFGLCIAGGLLLVALCIRGSWKVITLVWGDLIAAFDLRQAVDEWAVRHPDRAARYRDGSGPWQKW